MNYGEGGLSASDVALIQGNGRNNDGFGGENGSWWIIIFLIFAIFGGFGNRGFGGYGGGSDGANTIFPNYVLNSDFSTLSRQISDGFNTVERRTDNIINGICDLGYNQLNLSNGINQNVSNGFYNTLNAITTNGYETRLGQNAISSQLAQCCCDIREGISGINYNLATNTCSINNTINNSTRDIIDAITANRIEDLKEANRKLEARNSSLELKASQEAQNAFITQGFANEVDALYNRLSNCPVPTTPVYGRTPIFTCNNNNPCGCNSGCGGY